MQNFLTNVLLFHKSLLTRAENKLPQTLRQRKNNFYKRVAASDKE